MPKLFWESKSCPSFSVSARNTKFILCLCRFSLFSFSLEILRIILHLNLNFGFLPLIFIGLRVPLHFLFEVYKLYQASTLSKTIQKILLSQANFKSEFRIFESSKILNSDLHLQYISTIYYSPKIFTSFHHVTNVAKAA